MWGLRCHLPRDRYAITSPGCSKVSVHVNKVKDSIFINVTDNGKKTNRLIRIVKFNLGDYVIKQIAKSFDTKCHLTSSSAGNKLTITIPTQTKRGKDRQRKSPLVI